MHRQCKNHPLKNRIFKHRLSDINEAVSEYYLGQQAGRKAAREECQVKSFRPVAYAVTDLDRPGEAGRPIASERRIDFAGSVDPEKLRRAIWAYLKANSGDLGCWGTVIGFHFVDRPGHYYVLDINGAVLRECHEFYSPRIGLTYQRGQSMPKAVTAAAHLEN